MHALAMNRELDVRSFPPQMYPMVATVGDRLARRRARSMACIQCTATAKWRYRYIVLVLMRRDSVVQTCENDRS